MARLLPHAGRATPTTGPLGTRHPRRSNLASPASTESHETRATKNTFHANHNKKNAPSRPSQQKKGVSLFAARQPVAGQQKKSKNGPIKKNKYFPQAPGACPSTRTRRFLAGLFYGHGVAKPGSQMISLYATSF